MPEPSRWGRGVAAAAALALLVSSSAGPLASATSPGSPDAEEGPEDGWAVQTRVDATVVDNYATVDVSAEVTGNGTGAEFPFQVRIPDDAYVTGLQITRDNRTYEGEIQPAEAARASYEAAKARGQATSLVEARDRNTYRYFVHANESETVEATLTYEKYLAASNGMYTLPLEAPVPAVGEDRGGSFHVTVEHRGGVRDAWGTPSAQVDEANGTWEIHREVGARSGDEPTPFNASYTLEETGPGGSIVTVEENGTGYFAHRFRAAPDARDHPVDMSLVLDTSGSMDGLKIRQLRAAASQLAGRLDASDRLRLVPFDNWANASWSGFRPADDQVRAEARGIVDGFAADGSTNIGDAIDAGFRGFDEDPRPNGSQALGVLVFLTDGRPTTGLEDADALRAKARQANDGDARVFGLAFGHNADWNLVRGLAADGGGTAKHVPAGHGAEVDLREFMGRLTSPVLRNVTVDYDGPVQPFHPSAPVLFAGSELLVVGSYDAEMDRLRGNVTARRHDGPVEESFAYPADADDADFLPELVAYHRIRALEDEIEAVGERPDLVRHVRNLSLEHGFVTDYTSLVVTPRDADANATERLCKGCTGDALDREVDADPSYAASGGGGGGAPAQQQQPSGGSGSPAPSGGSSSSGSSAAGGSGSGSSGSGGGAAGGGSGSPAQDDAGTQPSQPRDDPGPPADSDPPADRSPGEPVYPPPQPSGDTDPPAAAEDRAAEGARRGQGVPGPGPALALAAAAVAGLARRRSRRT